MTARPVATLVGALRRFRAPRADGRTHRAAPVVRGLSCVHGIALRADAMYRATTGLGVPRDGTLLVGDDTTGVIYRVTYGQSG
jgi:hypothetical protein